jgi:protocatechuate 3,4-dioxygenase beta subunit
MRVFTVAFLSLVLATAIVLTAAPRPVARSQDAPSKPPRGGAVVPDAVPVIGRVIDPDGRPVAGAALHLGGRPGVGPWATDADGRFRFEVARDLLAESRPTYRAEPGPVLAAFAEGYGPAWTDDWKVGDPDGVVLKMATDDVPISGRLVDLEGVPAAGVTIKVIQIDEAPEGGLAAWLARNERAESLRGIGFYELRKPLGPGLARLIPATTTDPDGRFRLAGLGRERVVSLLVEGGGVEIQVLRVATRRGRRVSFRFGNDETGGRGAVDVAIYPAEFEAVVAPSRPVEGIVREQASGRPLPGAVVRADTGNYNAFGPEFHLGFDWRGETIRATTDDQGRYRIVGLPRRKLVALRADPDDGLPLHPIARAFDNTPDAASTQVDFSLPPAVLVRGRVVDRATGRPVAARVEYQPTLENRNVRAIPDRTEAEPRSTDSDGRFAVTALAGPGVVIVTALGDRFLLADVVESPNSRPPFPKVYGGAAPSRCHGFAILDAQADSGEIVRDFELTPSPDVLVTVLDPDGNPLAGARAGGILPADIARQGWWQSQGRAVFTATGLNQRRIRLVWFRHEARRLVGALAVRDSEPGGLAVRLQPWGTVSGRLVDAQGKPRADVALTCRRPTEYAVPWAVGPIGATTDDEGRFTFDGLAPGHEYVLLEAEGSEPDARLGPPLTLEAGEARRLGDVRK